MANQRIHGTTHEKPIERFVLENLTPANRPAYRYEQIRVRRVPTDALISIAAAHYSVPVQYVGQAVTIHESANDYQISHDSRLIARHDKSARHPVVMDPEHYRGLIRKGRLCDPPSPPRWDPSYLGLGEVTVRDLSVYECLAECGGES